MTLVAIAGVEGFLSLWQLTPIVPAATMSSSAVYILDMKGKVSWQSDLQVRVFKHFGHTNIYLLAQLSNSCIT